MSLGTWAKIILGVLEILKWAIAEGERRKWLAEGERRAIAAATAETLRMQNYAKDALAKFNDMPGAAVDDFLRSLEPPAGGKQ